MENFFEWFGQHYKWILSGLGIALLTALVRVIAWLFNQRAKPKSSRAKNSFGYTAISVDEENLDEVIRQVEAMALPYPRWINSMNRIYQCNLIRSLKRLDHVVLVNELQKRYVVEPTYYQKIPILLILLGLLEDKLPHYPGAAHMSDEKVSENVQYLLSIGVIEIAPLSQMVWLLHTIMNDCYS